MNKYVLYNQETFLVLGTFKALTKDTYELLSMESRLKFGTRKRFFNELKFHKSKCSLFALLDPNGSVIHSHLRLKDVTLEDGELKISTFQDMNKYA